MYSSDQVEIKSQFASCITRQIDRSSDAASSIVN